MPEPKRFAHGRPLTAVEWSALKARAAARYVRGGVDVESIAKDERVTPALVERALTETFNDSMSGDAVRQRQVENVWLDRLQHAVEDALDNSQSLSETLNAVKAGIQLSSRRATLNGMDAPQQVALRVAVTQQIEDAFTGLEELLLGEVEANVVEPRQIEAAHDDDDDDDDEDEDGYGDDD